MHQVIQFNIYSWAKDFKFVAPDQSKTFRVYCEVRKVLSCRVRSCIISDFCHTLVNIHYPWRQNCCLRSQETCFTPPHWSITHRNLKSITVYEITALVSYQPPGQIPSLYTQPNPLRWTDPAHLTSCLDVPNEFLFNNPPADCSGLVHLWIKIWRLKCGVWEQNCFLQWFVSLKVYFTQKWKSYHLLSLARHSKPVWLFSSAEHKRKFFEERWDPIDF